MASRRWMSRCLECIQRWWILLVAIAMGTPIVLFYSIYQDARNHGMNLMPCQVVPQGDNKEIVFTPPRDGFVTALYYRDRKVYPLSESSPERSVRAREEYCLTLGKHSNDRVFVFITQTVVPASITEEVNKELRVQKDEALADNNVICSLIYTALLKRGHQWIWITHGEHRTWG